MKNLVKSAFTSVKSAVASAPPRGTTEPWPDDPTDLGATPSPNQLLQDHRAVMMRRHEAERAASITRHAAEQQLKASLSSLQSSGSKLDYAREFAKYQELLSSMGNPMGGAAKPIPAHHPLTDATQGLGIPQTTPALSSPPSTPPWVHGGLAGFSPSRKPSLTAAEITKRQDALREKMRSAVGGLHSSMDISIIQQAIRELAAEVNALEVEKARILNEPQPFTPPDSYKERDEWTDFSSHFSSSPSSTSPSTDSYDNGGSSSFE